MAKKEDGKVFIGTSGWNYPNWHKHFYAGIPRHDWLEHCIRTFSGIECNASFDRLLPESTLQHWRGKMPAKFALAMKAYRYPTHTRRLRQIEESVDRQRENFAPLGRQLRVVLWEFPTTLEHENARFERFCRALAAWPQTRHAVEMRHRSWFTEQTRAMLEENRIAICQSDSADWPYWDAVSTDLVYVRLHGHTRTCRSRYSTRSLESWAHFIRRWRREGREVHVYFSNTEEGHAPGDAQRLLDIVGGNET